MRAKISALLIAALLVPQGTAFSAEHAVETTQTPPAENAAPPQESIETIENSKEDHSRLKEQEQRRFDDKRFEGERRHEDDRRRSEEQERQRFEQDEQRRAEDEQRMNERRFEDMKRNVERFMRDISRMEREAERTAKRLERCEFGIPAELTKTLDTAKGLAEKVKTANSADELEDIMFEFEDVGYLMGEWGRQMGPLQQVCEMLGNADREVQRLLREQDRMEQRAKQQKIDASLMLGKLRELSRKMEETLERARSLAQKSPEDAVFLIQDEIFFRMEEYHNAQRGLEMALDLRRGLQDAGGEIWEFKALIKELKAKKKDTTRLERLLGQMEGIKGKLDGMAQRSVDPDSVQPLIEEAFDLREEFVRLASHLGGGARFMDEKSENADEEDFRVDLPSGFKPSAKARASRDAERSGGGGGGADAQVQEIKAKAELLADNRLDAILSELKQLRDQVKEQQAEIKYLRTLTQDFAQLNEQMQTQLNTFITYGVDENSKRLGEGERAAVLHSYKSAFQALPEDERGIEDVIKIVNGRFPSQRSGVAEKQAKKFFREIYKRVANMENENDKAAIMVMAYGLRQAAQNRNLESEKRGIETFKNIFGYLPTTTEEWNAMQAITYSGAVRRPDSDKDGLSDADEKLIGTNSDKPDTDGDGIPDGDEVDEEFDPLKK